jgi:hypothetical protein
MTISRCCHEVACIVRISAVNKWHAPGQCNVACTMSSYGACNLPISRVHDMRVQFHMDDSKGRAGAVLPGPLYKMLRSRAAAS